MFFTPKWHRMLPPHLKVPSEKIDDLELLRKELDLPHEWFMRGIIVSPWAVIKNQEAVLEQNRRAAPNATEKELWRLVILSRLHAILANSGPFDPSREKMLQRVENLDDVANEIHSWDDVIKYVFELDKEAGMEAEGSVVQEEINRVLEGKLCSTLMLAKLRTK